MPRIRFGSMDRHAVDEALTTPASSDFVSALADFFYRLGDLIVALGSLVL